MCDCCILTVKLLPSFISVYSVCVCMPFPVRLNLALKLVICSALVALSSLPSSETQTPADKFPGPASPGGILQQEVAQ